MTAKLTGDDWTTRSGITINAPFESLPENVECCMEWAERIAHVLVFPDVQVTRRLKCYMVVNPFKCRIDAFREILDVIMQVIETDNDLLYMVQSMTADRITGYPISERRTLTRI